MAFSTIQNLDVAAHQRKSTELKKRLHTSESTTYVTGPTGNGNGEVVFVLGGTGYIGRALIPELVKRNYSPVVIARSAEAKNDKEFEGATVVVGDPTRAADVQKAIGDAKPKAVISLLSGRRPNDAEECRQVDHEALGNAIRASVGNKVDQFIQIATSARTAPSSSRRSTSCRSRASSWAATTATSTGPSSGPPRTTRTCR